MDDPKCLLMRRAVVWVVSCLGLACFLSARGPALGLQTGEGKAPSATLSPLEAPPRAGGPTSPSPLPPSTGRPTLTLAATDSSTAPGPTPVHTAALQRVQSPLSPARVSATPSPSASPSPDPTVPPQPPVPTLSISQEQVAEWSAANYEAYFQKYNLSCEAAVMRLACGALGITLTEDAILEMMPRHDKDPDLGLVIEELDGGVYNADGTINWRNYGVHAPVVALVLNRILVDSGYGDAIHAEARYLSDEALREELGSNPDCLGAIIWTARDMAGSTPPVNERGQVLGEHTQWAAPLLDDGGRMVVYDVWPWPDQPFHLLSPYNRALFANQVTVIQKVRARTAPEPGPLALSSAAARDGLQGHLR